MKTLKAVVVDALEDIKALEINTLDVTNLTDVTNHMIIASGTSATHVKAIADNVVRKMKRSNNPPIGVEGKSKDAEWILIDLGDIVVHVMHPSARKHYQLEKLWAM